MTARLPTTRTQWILLGAGAILVVNWGIQLMLEPQKPSGWFGMAAGVLMVISAVRGLLRARRERADEPERTAP